MIILLKRILIVGALSFLFFIPSIEANPSTTNNKDCSSLEAMFLTLLNENASKVILDRIGQSGMSYALSDAKIIKIERPEPGGFEFITTVRFHSFTGPHNPPYGTETLTYEITPFGAKLLHYHHVDSND